MFPRPTPSKVFIALLGSAIQAFGMANIHACSPVTEGGVLGMTLLLEHWLHISPAVSSLVLNALCYWLGWRLLGREFILYSAIASAGFSLFYMLAEPFAPLIPLFIATPLAAALSGAVFIGVGAGLCVRIGGATSGDDALAMSLAHLTHKSIQWMYLLTDLVVLALAASYIPLQQLAYSLLTVTISGFLINVVQKAGRSSAA